MHGATTELTDVTRLQVKSQVHRGSSVDGFNIIYITFGKFLYEVTVNFSSRGSRADQGLEVSTYV